MNRKPVKVVREVRQSAPVEREVHHFVEHLGVVQFVHGGRLLKVGAQFHDGLGLESLREAVVAEARRVSEEFGVTPLSSLVVRGVVTRREYSQVVDHVEASSFGGQSVPAYQERSFKGVVPPVVVEVPWASDGRQGEYELELMGVEFRA